MTRPEWEWTSILGEQGRMAARVAKGLLFIGQCDQPPGWNWSTHECESEPTLATLRFKGWAPTLKGAQMMAERFAPGREDTAPFKAPDGMASVMMYFDDGPNLTDAQNFRLQADKAVEADDKWREDLGGLWADPVFRKSLTEVSVGGQSGWREESKPAINDPQPPPRANLHPPVWPLVFKDMLDRHAEGERKYGVPLQPHNGRDALVDAYQEALDLCVYLRQAIYERDGGVVLPAEAP